MKAYVYPYKMGSKSSKSIANQLGAKRVWPDRKYKNYPTHLVINMGSSKIPQWHNGGTRYINNPESVGVATNKLKAFEAMKEAGVSVPKFTSNLNEVKDSLTEENSLQWLARTKLTGTKGQGIVRICGGIVPEEGYPEAGLYVEYIKKINEYRIHVFGGEVIDFAQKKKRLDMDKEDVDFQIRNHDNGWVFCREEIELPHDAVDQAVKAVEAIGLDFGAVDLVFNTYRNTSYVLEVNTCPGMEGTTLESYTEAFKKAIEEA